jgi:hypothetical protein
MAAIRSPDFAAFLFFKIMLKVPGVQSATAGNTGELSGYTDEVKKAS